MESKHICRHVAITGAGSGIGAALARHYAGPGVRLSLLGRNVKRLEAIALQCREQGAEAAIQGGDVADADAMAAWLAACESYRPIDLIVANAGMGGESVMSGPTGESLATAGRIVATNVQGVMNSIIPLLPGMIARRRGGIVIISSLAGLIPLPDSPVYCASKAAVRVYGLALRRLLAPHGLAVMVACPGFIDTPMSASLKRPLPFLWSVERAAGHIAGNFARGKREIAFPWQLALAVRLASFLPQTWVDRILIGLGA
jgi:short-subunit dehydrogenase